MTISDEGTKDMLRKLRECMEHTDLVQEIEDKYTEDPPESKGPTSLVLLTRREYAAVMLAAIAGLAAAESYEE